MNLRIAWKYAALLGILLSAATTICRADAPTTAPTIQLKPGPMDLTFTQRNPLSAPKEIARRMNLKPSEVADDYDLTKQSFKAYFPKDFDPAVPQAVLVFLGYKDTTDLPTPWLPVLDRAHMIFIAPVSHNGEGHPPSIPLWQTMGLALDGLYNLQQQCKIDPAHTYFMGWAFSTQIAFATSDIFDGYILQDPGYFKRIMLPENVYYPYEFSTPVPTFYQKAKRLPFFLIGLDPKEMEAVTIKMSLMKKDGFTQMQAAQLSSLDDLHYPNIKPEWFEMQALPFLYGAPVREAKAAEEAATRKASQQTTAAPTPAAPTPPSGLTEAAKLLSSAKLYIANNRPDLAKPKLQQIITDYPDDPAAAKAKDLLAQINQ